MSQLDALSDLEQDAITEVFNIGIGKAGASLSEMVDKEVSLSVPQLSITTLSQANENISASENRVSGVKECFDGAIAGNAILLFPESRIIDLIRLLFPPGMDEEMILEMEQDTMTEVGNIILNATLSALSDIMEEELTNKIPETFKGSISEVFFCKELTENADQHVLKMDMNMTVTDIDVQGDISFLILIKSIDSFKEKLASYFGFEQL